MSRIGKAPVNVPEGVDASVQGQIFTAKGKLGQLSFELPQQIKASLADNTVVCEPRTNDRKAKAAWGMARAMVSNVVAGVSEGFTKELEIKGVGYRAAVQGNMIDLNLGFSHPVKMPVPEGLTVTVNNNTEVVITGTDRQAVGQFAANIRAKRPPEPYKGKGVRYKGEYIAMKEGKKK